MSNLILIATSLCAGLLVTRVFKKFGWNFPDVTAFLIAGLLIGPYGLGAIGVKNLGFNTLAEVENLSIINTVALGFIAFSIGNEFKLSELKGIGKQATVIGILQATAAMVMVDIALLLIALIPGQSTLSVPAAITLGAIATATAPAATLMVVRQYKAKGALTSLLLPIVALDDAVGLVCFAVSFGIAQALVNGSANMIAIIVNPLIEIVASIGLGALMGYILTKLETLFYSNTNRFTLSIAFVLFTIAISSFSFKIGKVTVSFSSLLVCMMLGTVLCNLCPRSEDIMQRSEKWTAPLNTLFFVLSGAELELGVFKNYWVVAIGLIYIFARSFGKYYGARGSARLTKCSPTIQKYLGFTLLPQAGVALGMCTQAVTLGSYDGKIIRNIVLFAVLIYELVGPSITHWALKKAGDITEKEEEKKSHTRFNVSKVR